MEEAGCSSTKDCFIYTYANDPAAGIDNWVYLDELKDSNLQKAQITVSSAQLGNWGFFFVINHWVVHSIFMFFSPTV